MYNCFPFLFTHVLNIENWVLIKRQQLEPDYAKNLPLCMYSFKWMFNACRYPAKPSDYESKFDPKTNNHMTVIRKNKFFIVDLVKEGKQLSTFELER